MSPEWKVTYCARGVNTSTFVKADTLDEAEVETKKLAGDDITMKSIYPSFRQMETAERELRCPAVARFGDKIRCSKPTGHSHQHVSLDVGKDLIGSWPDTPSSA